MKDDGKHGKKGLCPGQSEIRDLGRPVRCQQQERPFPAFYAAPDIHERSVSPVFPAQGRRIGLRVPVCPGVSVFRNRLFFFFISVTIEIYGGRYGGIIGCLPEGYSPLRYTTFGSFVGG